MLPESSQKKLNEGVVVSCGPGAVDADGDVCRFYKSRDIGYNLERFS